MVLLIILSFLKLIQDVEDFKKTHVSQLKGKVIYILLNYIACYNFFSFKSINIKDGEIHGEKEMTSLDFLN